MSIPPGVTTFVELEAASGVPEAEARKLNGGLSEPFTAGAKVKLPGCRDHLVVVDRDAAGPDVPETKQQIADQNGVTPAALEKANPKVTADGAWGTLTESQRILIPRH